MKIGICIRDGLFDLYNVIRKCGNFSSEEYFDLPVYKAEYIPLGECGSSTTLVVDYMAGAVNAISQLQELGHLVYFTSDSDDMLLELADDLCKNSIRCEGICFLAPDRGFRDKPFDVVIEGRPECILTYQEISVPIIAFPTEYNKDCADVHFANTWEDILHTISEISIY